MIPVAATNQIGTETAAIAAARTRTNRETEDTIMNRNTITAGISIITHEGFGAHGLQSRTLRPDPITFADSPVSFHHWIGAANGVDIKIAGDDAGRIFEFDGGYTIEMSDFDRFSDAPESAFSMARAQERIKQYLDAKLAESAPAPVTKLATAPADDFAKITIVRWDGWNDGGVDGADVYADGVLVACIQQDESKHDYRVGYIGPDRSDTRHKSYRAACTAARKRLRGTPRNGVARTAADGKREFLTHGQAEHIVADGRVQTVKLDAPEWNDEAPRYELHVDGRKIGTVYQYFTHGFTRRTGKPTIKRDGWKLITAEDRPRFGKTLAALKIEAVKAAHCLGY